MLEVTCLGLETEEGTAEEGRLTSLCSPPRLRTRGAAVTWWAGTEIERVERREGEMAVTDLSAWGWGSPPAVCRE